QLTPEQLKSALAHFHQLTGLTWDILLGPFERLEAFRGRADRLQTVVLRIANCVAKADGHVEPEEVRQLQWIQAEMQRVLERVPFYSPYRVESGPTPALPAPRY